MEFLKTTATKFFTLLVLLVGFCFFAFPQSADACDVKKGSSTRFRTGFGTQINQPEDFFSDEDNPPFLYVDIDTEDCEETDTLTLSIWGLVAKLTATDINTPGDIFRSQGVYNHPINIGNANPDDQGRFTVALKVGSELCFGNNDPYDCLIMGAIRSADNSTILAIIGNALANLNQADANFFLTTFQDIQEDEPVPTPSEDTGNGCSVSGTKDGFYYQQSISCLDFLTAVEFPFNGYSGSYFSSAFDEQLRTYYNNYPNLNVVSNPPLNPPQHYVFSEDTESGENEFRIAIPGIRFKCPGITSCGDSEWGIPEYTFIPYGQNYPGEDPSIVDPLPSNYQEEYIPLADLPFEGLNGGPTPSLGEYLASIFRMAIVVIVILAVLMIVYHGVAYATTGAVGKKDDHRTGVWNAVLGLVLALGSWLLLNTVSPRLASQLSINIPNVNLDGYDYIEDGVAVIPSGCPKPGTLPAVCPTCQTIAEGVPIKNSINTPEHNKILAGMNTKLVQLNSTLSQNSISWQITEAFKNTVNHCSVCHYRGTCVDANFTGGSQPTIENIKAFIQSASSAGLRAVYETNNQSTYQTLLDADIPKSKGDSGNLLWLQNITAPHFSVYNK